MNTSQRGLSVERRVVFLQLVGDRARVAHRVGVVVERRDVDEVQQQPRARRWRRNWWPRPGALGRAFDEARDVGDDEARVARRRAPRRAMGLSVVNG